MKYRLSWQKHIIVSTPPPKLREGLTISELGDRGGLGLRHLKGGVAT